MTDQETPGFKVVDKRRAAPDSVDSVTPGVVSDPALSAPETDAAEPPTASEVEPPEPTDEPTPDERGDSGSGMPDPGMLLSFAAMQMDVRTLMRILTAVFDGQAWRSLGLVADPSTGEVRKDLPAAQLAIDAVQFLIGKLEADLPDGDRRELQRRLNDLRMNYLVKVREG